MKKTIFALAIAALLAGCAVTPSSPVAARGGSQIAGFATLSLWGSWEAELAPAYTRLAALQHRAARQLDAGAIGQATATEIRDKAAEARELLDASRRGNAAEPTAEQRVMLVQAQHLLYQAEQLLEH